MNPEEMGEEDNEFEFDLSGVEDKPKHPIGVFTAYVQDVIKETSEKTGMPQLVLTWKTAKGNIKQWQVLTPNSMWVVGKILSALDLGRPGERVKLQKSAMIGKRATITVSEEAYNGKTNLKVTEVKRHVEGPIDNRVKGPDETLPF